ncbi:MAG: hypothetical protein QW101_02920 [Ignisphaera sp.]|uniref:Uncharacterized protein n=1 Tax=Ignisphaera aggregans TaxID=334771 RepID=A0A7J3MZ97_9CREN
MFRKALTGILLILAVSIVTASLFAYYPLDITVVPQQPEVRFVTGSNAGKPDIGGNTIIVNIGTSGASASIEIHPTYQETYYKDILGIVNNDNDAMHIYVIFYTYDNSLPVGNRVKMFVYSGATIVKELDITTPTLNTAQYIGQLPIGGSWQIDLYVYIPEGTSITGRSYSASARLVYTPSSGEAPPINPNSGR